MRGRGGRCSKSRVREALAFCELRETDSYIRQRLCAMDPRVADAGGWIVEMPVFRRCNPVCRSKTGEGPKIVGESRRARDLEFGSGFGTLSQTKGQSPR